MRNSIDHGIEPPKEREDLGKNSTGTVFIEAKHEGGEVWIVISDDGRGLNREKIFEKVLIPNSQANIKRIQTFLGEAERSSVVRSKLAKKGHAATGGTAS